MLRIYFNLSPLSLSLSSPLAVFAQQSSNSESAPVTSPTPIRLIEKYSKHDGREHWIAPQYEATQATPWGASIQELQQRKLQRIAAGLGGGGGSFQKRAVPPEQPTPTSSPQCEPFEHVDTEQKILYSPGYPGNYPNNTNCHVVLEGKLQSIYCIL